VLLETKFRKVASDPEPPIFHPKPEAPIFDPEHGYPCNQAAKEVCAKRWKASGRYQNQDRQSGGLQDEEADNIDFVDLSEATGNFSSEFRISGGGSCAVYRAVLYGVTVAIKVGHLVLQLDVTLLRQTAVPLYI
jgi:hypothetical protein